MSFRGVLTNVKLTDIVLSVDKSKPVGSTLAPNNYQRWRAEYQMSGQYYEGEEQVQVTLMNEGDRTYLAAKTDSENEAPTAIMDKNEYWWNLSPVKAGVVHHFGFQDPKTKFVVQLSDDDSVTWLIHYCTLLFLTIDYAPADYTGESGPSIQR
ncbi:hypothetical protein BDR05DRAFT_1006038 [Suillus weaverae]|nr:hypothetical protein BDR05DRAFT_1006038 [Suillus weaverae]